MQARLSAALLLATFGVAGCNLFGSEVAEAAAARRESDGKAVGGACRHAGRAIEDCYTLNRRADKAAVYAGWREMNDYMILDIGPKTATVLADQLKAAGTIVWNGPVGVFEFDAFAKGTETIARAIAASPAFSIAGGGDTLAAIAKYGIDKDIDYISTGGGAFLEVLEGKTLPAFEILQARAQG